MADPCDHRWAGAVLARGGRRGQRVHLRCTRCGHVDPIPTAHHAWVRPGRDRAHGRPVVCEGGTHELPDQGEVECLGREVPPEIRYDCAEHERGPHGVRVRPAGRSGLVLLCRACTREASAAREIDPEVARAAAARYYARHGRERRQARQEADAE